MASDEITLEDWKQALEAWHKVENTVNELDDVVRGDPARNIRGLIRDMEVVNAFILKWEKREYAIRLVMGLLSANILLTGATIITTFIVNS
jgi:hypothetical protein